MFPRAVLFATGVWAAASQGNSSLVWPPTVKSVSELGHLNTPDINRDSCGSTRFFDRVLWVCRDTQPRNASGFPIDPVWSSSASWADFSTTDHAPTLDLYGGNGSETAWYPYAADECPHGKGRLEGTCDSDNTRFALWPDTPPLITSNVSGVITAYTWIRQSHIRMDLSSVVKDPPTSLYKVTYAQSTKDPNALPTTALIKESFWDNDTIPYGAYGNIVLNNTAYLFGQPSNGNIALARVQVDQIEDRSSFEYYVNNSWTKTQPTVADSGTYIPNAGGGGQGTYFFSDYWNKFVWIGQGRYSVSPNFMITMSDKIEGPWEEPISFYSTKGGTYRFPGYSLQAHPSLSTNGVTMDSAEIWISYTKVDQGPNMNFYYHPLIQVIWD